jgi:monoamine oxidase
MADDHDLLDHDGTDRDGGRTPAEPPLDVVIVGGGFAGLAAARELDALGVRFVLLDAAGDHLGGRAYSYDATAGDPSLRFDHGAEYVGDMQDEIMLQIRELLPEGALINGAALRAPYPWEVMVLGGERFVFRSDDSLFGIPGCPPQLGFLAALSMIGLLAEMTLTEWSIDVLEPWSGPEELLALDQTDVWTWLSGKWWVPDTVRDLVRISVEALLSVEPSEISPYYLLWYTACNDGFLNEINDDTGGPQQYWLRGGTDELAQRYAEPVARHVRRGVRVRTIAHGGPLCTVTIDTGEELRAKKVLVATSPNTAGRITFDPPAPPAHAELMRQPMGRTIKCQLFYRTRWWHDSNGKAYDGYVGGADQPVLWVMDNSPPEADAEGGPFVLMTFTVGRQADALGQDATDEEITRWVTDALASLFDDERAKPSAGDLLRCVSYTWMPDERIAGGGPNTIMGPGKLTGDVGRALDADWNEQVFFASAENAKKLRPRSRVPHFDLSSDEKVPAYTDDVRDPTPAPPYHTRYSDMRSDLGYMSGAMESGRFVAHAIARSLGRDHALPARAAAEAPPPPAPAPGEGAPLPYDASAVAAVLARLRDRLASTDAAALRASGRAARRHGRGGVASWLRDALVEELRAAGHVAPRADRGDVLRTVRDFAVATIGHARAAAPNGGGGEQAAVAAHADAIDDHLSSRVAS